MRRIAQALKHLPIFERQPPNSVVDSAGSIALVVADPRHVRGQRWFRAAERRGAAIDVLSLGEPIRRPGGKLTSFVAAPPQAPYDCVIVNSRIELFEHSWSYAFLDRLNTLTAPGGAVVVPKSHDSSCIPESRFIDLFGRAPDVSSSSYLSFKRAPNGLRRPYDADHSTLDAYWPLMDTLTYRRFESKLAHTIRALGASSDARPPREAEADLLSLLRSQAYRTCSVRFKAPITEYVASVYFPGRSGLRMADLGAGTGLNSLELVLNPGPVTALTLVEPRRSYHWHIAAVIDRVREQLRGTVSIMDSKIENYDGPKNDMGLVCAVLVMVPKELRKKFISSAWSNLAPGGILLVLENMYKSRRADGEPYNDQRCTPREVDSLLGRFAPIRYFSSTAKRELSFRSVGDQTVFRVIQKPAEMHASD